MPHMDAKHSVIFSHGKEGTPDGGKILRLRAIADDLGLESISIDYRGLELAPRKERLRQVIDRTPGTIILVGSSMGGYLSLSMATDTRVIGVFAMAPAIGLPHYPDPTPDTGNTPVEIVHGLDDTIVPPRPVIDYCHTRRVPLTLLPDGHRLLVSLPRIAVLFRTFLHSLIS